MRYAPFVALLTVVSLVSKVQDAAATDGSTGTTSVGQAQISLTIPERFDVRVAPDAPRNSKISDRIDVQSNMTYNGLKYSVKRVVFVDRTGKAVSHGLKSANVRTQVVVVVPE
jgi:hypothetical protein